MHKISKTTVILFALFISAVILFYLSWNTVYVGYFLDDAIYITLAKALLLGKGYRHIGAVNEPIIMQFPPGFPIFLTPFVAIVKNQYHYLKWLNIFISSFSMLLCYFTFYKKLPQKFMWLLLFFFITNTMVITFSVSVMSDPLFLLLSMLFFILLSKYETIASSKLKFIIGFMLGILIALNTSIRAIGILLLIPLFVLGVKKRDLKLLIGGLFPLTLLLIGAKYYGWLDFYSADHHGKPFTISTQILGINFIYYIPQIISILSNNFPLVPLFDGIKMLLWILLIPFGYGFYIHWKQNGGIWCIYFIAYLAMILFYRMRDPRLLLPIVPFLYYFILYGLTQLRNGKRYIISFAMIILLIQNSIGLVTFFKNEVLGHTIKNSIDHTTYKWIRENTTPKDIILSGVFHRAYLFIERKGCMYAKQDTRAKMLHYIFICNVSYIYIPVTILATEATGEDVFGFSDYWRLIQEDPLHFKLVFQAPDTKSLIYKVLPRKATFLAALSNIDQGNQLYQKGSYKEAISEFNKALSLEPDFYLPLNLLGMALVDSGQINKGIEILTKSIKLYPTLERGYAALAYAYKKKGDKVKAEDYLQKAFKLAQAQGHSQLAIEIQQELGKLR